MIDSILGSTEFEKYFEFLEKYGEAVFRTLQYKENDYLCEYRFERADNIINIFDHGRILCLTISDRVVKVNDEIVIENENGNKSIAKIFTIQQNHTDVIEVNAISPIDIGITAEMKFLKSDKIYLRKIAV